MLKRAKTPFLSRPYPLFPSRAQALAVLFGGSAFVGYLSVLPNFTLDPVTALHQAEEDDTPIALSQKMREICKQAKSDVGLSHSSHSVKIFCTFNETSKVYGAAKPAGSGAVIGIPVFLNAEKAEEVPVGTKVTHPDYFEAVERYKESSLLSDSAKRYVVVEALLFAKEPYHYYCDAMISSLFCLGTFLLGSTIVRNTRLINERLKQRSMAYVFSGLLFSIAGIYFSFYVNCVLFEKLVLSCLNEKHVDGGIEYYEKLLARRESGRSFCSAGLVREPLYHKVYNQRLLALIEKKLSFVQSS